MPLSTPKSSRWLAGVRLPKSPAAKALHLPRWLPRSPRKSRTPDSGKASTSSARRSLALEAVSDGGDGVGAVAAVARDLLGQDVSALASSELAAVLAELASVRAELKATREALAAKEEELTALRMQHERDFALIEFELTGEAPGGGEAGRSSGAPTGNAGLVGGRVGVASPSPSSGGTALDFLEARWALQGKRM